MPLVKDESIVGARYYRRTAGGENMAHFQVVLQENISARDAILSADVLDEIERIHLRLPNPAP